MRGTFLAAAAAFAFASSAAAEEGMWTFDNVPTARMRQEIGWAPDQAWLDRTMAGAARLQNGCSASIVSASGLVLTNQHCVVACVRNLSTTANNYVDDGFVAARREDELRCQGMAVQILTGISDITTDIERAIASAGADGLTRARDAEIARLEAECTQGSERCEVVTLYQGGRYSLYRYRRYEDVRLAFAPENSMAQYGGNLTDFEFPIHCIDFALLRLYENGAPAATPSRLRMRFTPLADGEPVLITGNPGTTSRLRTMAELAFARDYELPWQLNHISEHRGRFEAYSDLGPDQARSATSLLRSTENGFKALYGRRLALVSAAGVARISAAENDLRQRINRNRALRREVGDAFGEIERAETAYRGFYLSYRYLDGGPFGSDLFSWARDLVRAADERAKPDSERLPRYTEARLATVEQNIRAARPVDPALEEIVLSVWLTRLQTYLTINDPDTDLVLQRQNPDALAHALVQSRLADPAYREQLWEGGAAAVAASEDPMIQFIRRWDGAARAVRTRYQTDVEGPVTRAHERISRARFRRFGEEQYPDATFTLRLSYGRVAGLTEVGGRQVTPLTRVADLYAAAGPPPFAPSARWRDAQARIDGNAILTVATTNDIIGGNSGSPLLDRDGAVVGAVFDGNIHSLAGEYYYDGALNRAVAVAATGIQAALRDVYRADALLAELSAE